MKTLLKTTVTAITLYCIMAFASMNANKETHITTTLEPSYIASIIDPDIVKPELPKNQTGLFLNKLGHKESGNRYDVVNSYGYMGRYQFGMKYTRRIRVLYFKRGFFKLSCNSRESYSRFIKT